MRRPYSNFNSGAKQTITKQNNTLKILIVFFCLLKCMQVADAKASPSHNHQQRKQKKDLQPQVQNQDGPIPLSSVLKQLTATYKVNFLYEETHITRKAVKFNIRNFKSRSIEEVLNTILPALKLKWFKVDDKNYSIFSEATKVPLIKKIGTNADTILLLQNSRDPISVIPFLKDSLTGVSLKEVSIVTSKPIVITKSDRFILDVANSPMASGSSLQLLKVSPFVKVGADNSVSLQGRATMVLIDNKPIPESALQNILETLPAGNISQIELITHPSAKYDAAYGSVINIITKKSKIEGLTGSVKLDASSGKYANGMGSGSLTYKHQGLTLYGTAGLKYGDDYFANNELRSVGFNNSTGLISNVWQRRLRQTVGFYHLSADLELGKGQTIGVIADGNIMHFKGPWTTVNAFSKAGSRPDSILYTRGTFEQPVFMGSFNLNYHLLADSGHNELSVLTTYTPFSRDLKQNFPSELKDAEGETLRIPPPFRTWNQAAIHVYIAQVDYTHVFEHQLKLETGLKYQKTNSSNEINYEQQNATGFETVPLYSSDNTLRESIGGAYGILSKDWKKDKVQLGVRAEHTEASFVGNFDMQFTTLFPNLNYQHNFTDQNNVSMSFKRTISRAPYYELVPYSVFLNSYTVEQGNPAIKPSYDNIILSVQTSISSTFLSVTPRPKE
jgi:hypothetical protein